MLDLTALVDVAWRVYPASALALVGVLYVWRGIGPGPGQRRGLFRGGADDLGWIGGFRSAIVGLALLGVGVAWVWQIPWLAALALGVGGVEALESSVILAGARRRRRRATA